jgi:UDPglucose 6-dehydrogenase
MFMHLIVVGAGYVGLTAAAVFAESGHHVSVVEEDATKVALLSRGKAPFHEPGLDDLVASCVASGRLRFFSSPSEALQSIQPTPEETLVAFIAVGTPASADGRTDESQLQTCAVNLGAAARDVGIRHLILAIKSTAPVGAATRVHDAAQAAAGITTVSVVVNPEFLRSGSTVKDFKNPDRVVVGGSNSEAVDSVCAIYTPFVPAEKILRVGEVSASLIKYASNAMLATRISFMNELAALASKSGADIEEIRRGVGADVRIGADYLQAGMGYGGSCLSKDVSSLISQGETFHVNLGVVRAVAAANEQQAHLLGQMLAEQLGSLQGRSVAVWGFSFKGGSDDTRNSLALVLVDDLVSAGATVRIYDPSHSGHESPRSPLPEGATFVSDKAAAIHGADALAITADWPEFRGADLPEISATLKERLIVDGRNIFDPAAMESAGLRYMGIGRSTNR